MALVMTVASLPLSMSTPAAAATSYLLDTANRTITVSPTATDPTAAISSALTYLANRSDKASTWTLKFEGGKYNITRALRVDYLQNVNLVSDKANPAVLIKSPTGTSEYIFYFRFAKTIKMSGFTFYGKTTFANGPTPVWGEQGVYFGSCNGIVVDWNTFYNFGDAALRVTTDYYDPVQGVNSFNTKVTNNIFNNIYQISTTSNDTVHGATNDYLFQYNSIYNLRGSVKFASRTPGAANVRVRNNIFNGGDHYGLEINNYNNFIIADNQMSNYKGPAISIYTNESASSSFQWGDDFTISKNTITNSARAIRFSPNAYADGTQVVPKRLVIDTNTISGITETDPFIPAIGVFKGTVDGLTITNNKLSKLTNKKAVGYTSGCTVTSISNNLLDDLLYVALKL
jgi:hypothetical protein